MRVLVLFTLLGVLLGGSQASRYCSYHPEAPECVEYLRSKPHYEHHYRDPNWEREVAPLQDDNSAEKIEAQDADVIAINNATSIVTPEGGHGLEVVPAQPAPSAASLVPPKEENKSSSTDHQSIQETAPQVSVTWHLLTRGLKAIVPLVVVVALARLLGPWWVARQARKAEAITDIAALQDLLHRGSPFAALVDAATGSSLAAGHRIRLEARLADLLVQRQCALDAQATELGPRLEAANRKSEFAIRWTSAARAKAMTAALLERFLAEAEEVGSEFTAVIQQYLEFRRGLEQESSTLRLTEGEESGAAASLTSSGQLRLSATEVSGSEEEEEEERDSEEEEEREGTVTSVNVGGGERNAAKRRSARRRSGPLGSYIVEDYEEGDRRSVSRELARQTDAHIVIQLNKMRQTEEALRLEREKLRHKKENKLQQRQEREEENEMKREQARLALEQQERTNKTEQDKLNLQKQQAQMVLREADERRAWEGLKTKLLVHAGIYGGTALYHLWHGLLDSWRSALDLSATCIPSMGPMSLLVGEVCLPDLTAYLPPLHVLLTVVLFFVVLGSKCGGLLQLPSWVTLLGLFFAVWRKSSSVQELVGGLGVVVVAQILVFVVQWVIASTRRSEWSTPRPIRVLGAVLTAIEVLLFLVNLGLALALFSRRRDDVLHDSVVDCFSTPSDFSSCYTYY